MADGELKKTGFSSKLFDLEKMNSHFNMLAGDHRDESQTSRSSYVDSDLGKSQIQVHNPLNAQKPVDQKFKHQPVPPDAENESNSSFSDMDFVLNRDKIKK